MLHVLVELIVANTFLRRKRIKEPFLFQEKLQVDNGRCDLKKIVHN